MAILAPLQEGMQLVPSKKVNLERFKAKKGLTPARHWLRRWAPFRRPRRQTSESGYQPGMQPHSQALGSVGVAALERGLFCPLELEDPDDIFPVDQDARAGGTGPLQGHRPRKGPAHVPADLDSEDGKLSLILWAMKRHQGELRMFGGVWRKHASGEIRRGADQQFKLAPEELLALERRTHPYTCEQDHIDPVIYTALEIRAQVNRGERPAPEQVVGIFWARGDGVFWTRQTRRGTGSHLSISTRPGPPSR